MPYPILKNRIVKKTQRKARGYGSGRGSTSGRGHKGQLSRSGSKRMRLKESGHTPLYKRLPALRGFSRHWTDKPEVVNLRDLNNKFKAGEEVTLSSLKDKQLITPQAKAFKILSQGELEFGLTIGTEFYSQAAKAKMDKAGCKFVTPAEPQEINQTEDKPATKKKPTKSKSK